MEQKIIPRLIEEEMKQSYVDYAMSVIIGRALPDIRDGLKPVHRRILFAMNELGMLHNKPFKKSARVVGDTLAKFHPHGDASVYDALVRMAQDFSLRYPLIDGQGNFGSLDGDSAAAYRYTEARLKKIAEEMLADIEKETVDFVPNFDGTLQEPVVLPSKIPNLLINGSSGIAVGMATNIPPHNVTEICNALIAKISNPSISLAEIMQFVKGPDFPTGGIIIGKSGIVEAYSSGRGKIIVRAKTSIEDHKNRKAIIINEIPYQVNKSALIEEIANLVRDKKITGISDIRDESDREGMRIVLELKKDANPEVVTNQLYSHTNMQTTFGIIILALVDNEPKVLSLLDALQIFIEHRRNVVKRRTAFDLRKAEEKLHILEGLIVALNNIEPVIEKIKKAKDAETAKQVLIADYSLSEIQAKSILEMRLQRLASLEQQKIRDDHKGTASLIAELKSILASEEKINNIIKMELEEIKQNYGDARRTTIEGEEVQIIETEDLIKEEEVVVTISHAGYIKRMSIQEYREQNRGGKGIIAATTKEEDFVEDLFVSSTHASLLVFTNKGIVHWLKVYQIPEASRQAKGTPIVNLVELEQGDKISAVIPVRQFQPNNYLFFATKKGTVKKTALEEYSNPRKGGIIAVLLDEGDDLIDVKLTSGSDEMIIATKNGNAVRFSEKDVRPTGRATRGVIGINLKENDEVVGMVNAIEGKSLLTVTELGYGKRTSIEDYRLISRGGVGVINIKITDKNGKVAAIKAVNESDQIMVCTKQGIAIRIPVDQISEIGRNTQGVRIIRLEQGDIVTACAKIAQEQ